MRNKNWTKSIILETDTVGSAIKNLSSSGLRICLVVNSKKKLAGTVTDGDLRNHILNKKNLNIRIKSLMNRKPLFVKENLPNEKIIEMMKLNNILQIPILDKDKFIVGLKFWNEIFNEKDIVHNNLIFMAGGQGLRLRPLTKDIPKPMIKINGKPLIAKLIHDAVKQGFINYSISINYLGEKIKNYFKDGKKFNALIDYIKEKKPLGTAGSLGHLNQKKISKTFVVINSDIITNIDYKKLIKFHDQNNADLTVVIKSIFTKHSFSVVESKGVYLKSVREKPTTEINYGIGIYVLNKKVLKNIKKGEFLNMPDFVRQLKKNNKFKILAYKMSEDWRDIGRPEDIKSYKF